MGGPDDNWVDSGLAAVLPDGRMIQYTGPYRVDMYGHGSYCGPHGYGNRVRYHDHDPCQIESDPLLVVEKCQSAILASDLVFVWLDSREAYGTLVEIGMAVFARSSPCVVVAMPEDDRELWFAPAAAGNVVYAPDAGAAWVQYWKSPLRCQFPAWPRVDPDDEDEFDEVEFQEENTS